MGRRKKKPTSTKKFVRDLDTRWARKALAFKMFYDDPFQAFPPINDALREAFGKTLDHSDDLRPLRNLALTLHGYAAVGPDCDCKNIMNARVRIQARPQLKLDGIENYEPPSYMTKAEAEAETVAPPLRVVSDEEEAAPLDLAATIEAVKRLIDRLQPAQIVRLQIDREESGELVAEVESLETRRARKRF